VKDAGNFKNAEKGKEPVLKY